MASGKTYARAAAAVAGMLLAVPVLMAQPTAPVQDNRPPVTLITAVPDDTPLFFALGDWSPDDDPVYYTASNRDALTESPLLGMPGLTFTAGNRNGQHPFNLPGRLHKV